MIIIMPGVPLVFMSGGSITRIFGQILVTSVGSYYEQGKDGRIGLELFLFHLPPLLLDPFLLSLVMRLLLVRFLIKLRPKP